MTVHISRSNITDPFQRMVQAMCDAARKADRCSACELCDEPCDHPHAIACAKIALALGAKSDDIES